MKKRYESDVKPDKCPKCGAPVYRIQYGLPMMSEEEYFKTYHEHVIYGGCCVSEDDPKWACSKCGVEIYQTSQIPKTKKEAFALLDAMLSEEDKQAVVESDVYDLHFSLGLWIRNNWLYAQNQEDSGKLLKAFGDDSLFCDPDDLSAIIIKAYRNHLKRKRR